MERKGGSVELVVTREEVRESLAKAELTASEENILRMRHGVGVTDPNAPLPRAAPEGDPLADELLAIEMELFHAQRERLRPASGPSSFPQPTPRRFQDPAAAKAREKIVRALRKKK